MYRTIHSNVNVDDMRYSPLSTYEMTYVHVFSNLIRTMVFTYEREGLKEVKIVVFDLKTDYLNQTIRS